MKITLKDYMSALVNAGYTVAKTVAKAEEINVVKFPSSLVSFQRAIIMSDGDIADIKSELIEGKNDEGDYIALQNEADISNCTWIAIITLIEEGKKVTVNVATTSEDITVENCDDLEATSISSI